MVSLIQFYRQKFQTLTKTIKYNHCTMSPQHRNITNEGVQYRYRFTKTQNPTSYRLTKQREREREREDINHIIITYNNNNNNINSGLSRTEQQNHAQSQMVYKKTKIQNHIFFHSVYLKHRPLSSFTP